MLGTTAATNMILSCLLLCCCQIFAASPDQQEMKAKPGDDVTLPCQSTRDTEVSSFSWQRPDLKSEGYIFFFRNGLVESYQHPDVKGRVKLRDDSSLKDGDMSVILKNVSINDSGTYECSVGENNKEPELRNKILLKVEDSGHTAGNITGEEEGKNPVLVRRFPALCVLLLLVAVGLVGFIIWRKREHLQKITGSGAETFLCRVGLSSSCPPGFSPASSYDPNDPNDPGTEEV